MRRLARSIAGSLALLLAAAAAAEPPARPPGLGDVLDVRHWSYEGYTRVVVELDRGVEPSVHRLPPALGRPERLYLDLDGVWVGRRFAEPIPVADGLLHDVRLGQNTLRRTRLVIDLARYERHRVLLLRAPHRVVIDIYAEPDAAAGHHAAPGRRLPVGLRPVRTVVVDPGHGGRDPGAIGPSGLREKDVTLRVAQALRAQLEERGFQVVLTRSDDVGLSLEERTAQAEGSRGDVFVSLHANAARRRGAHGIETYYLDASHERHTLRLASLENGTRADELDELQRTVATLRVSESSRRSAGLAATVHGALVAGLRGQYRDVQDLGVKRGPFYVLFLSSMPAILVETGFLTHHAEGRRLRSQAYAERVALHIAQGLERWRDGSGPLLAERAP